MKALALEMRRQRIQPVAHHDHGVVEFGAADCMQHGLRLRSDQLAVALLVLLPLPQGQGSLRPTFGSTLRTGWAPLSSAELASASS